MNKLEFNLKPEVWCELTGVEVIDPDGWLWGGPVAKSKDWETPISFNEFMTRCHVSTTNMVNAQHEVCKLRVIYNVLKALDK